MWIIPKNYQPSSVFAADTLASKEDLTLPGLNIESSLMWRSKPSPLQTWSLRWKRENWLRHLFGRTLKPSQHTCFETALTSSLAAIRANRSARQVSEQGQTIQDTCGHLLESTSTQLDLLDVFLKTSKATSRLDLTASSAIWKKIVIKQRGEYSARKKLAHRTDASECLSWATPMARDWKDSVTTTAKTRKDGKKRNDQLPRQIAQLNQKNWPTPDVAQAQKIGNRPNHGQLGLANHPQVHGAECTREPMKKDSAGRPGQDQINTNGSSQELFGKLNANWVEQLMGIPTAWTDLGFWGTE